MKKRIVGVLAQRSLLESIGLAREKSPLVQLDETICKLESMGTILTQLATNEEEEPELTSLADLGRIIQWLAMEALELTISQQMDKTQVGKQ